MAKLKTDYVNDILDTTKNAEKKYKLINNDDGTISLREVTAYTQEGSPFGATDINATNIKVNNFENRIDWQDKAIAYSQGKNLITFPYDNSSVTKNGITFTVNTDDGSITVKGTSTANTFFNLTNALTPIESNWKKLNKGTYCIQSNCSDQDIYMKLQVDNTSGDEYSDQRFTITEDKYYKIYLYVPSGKTVDGIVYPMLEEGYVSHSYEPTTESNVTLAKNVSQLNSKLTETPINLICGYDVKEIIGKKIGKRVKIDFLVRSNAGYIYNWVTIITIGDSSNYPTSTIYFPVSFINADRTTVVDFGIGKIDTNGVLSVMPKNATPTFTEACGVVEFWV